MNSNSLQVALREMQSSASSARFWIGLFCVVAVLTVSGPFDTAIEFTTPQRFAYWLGVAVSTYFLALICMVPVLLLAARRGWHWLIGAGAAGIVSGVPVGLLVYCINTYIARNDAGGVSDALRLIGICIVITVAVACLRHVLTTDQNGPDPQADNSPSAPAILKRLPHDKRAAILTLNAQDHYVEVTTAKGRELILLRLADAIDELGPLDGMRIHRSWWVARTAVQGLDRDGGRMMVRLVDGGMAPVSRANEKPVKAWLDR